MKKQYTAMVVSQDSGLSTHIRRELNGQIASVRTAAAIGQAYQDLKRETADLTFIDLSDSPENQTGLSAMEMVRRIKQHCPDTSLFLMHDHPDSDLILSGFRNGATDFLQAPSSDHPEKAGELVQRVNAVLGNNHHGLNRGEVFSVFSLKGGLGVSFTVLNLADQIRALSPEDRVLILDMNLLMGQLSTYVEAPPEFTTFELAANLNRMDENLLFSSICRHDQGFYILTTPEQVNDTDGISAEDVKHMMALLKSHFDYIIVDAPHDFSNQTLALLSATDHLLVLTEQNLPAARSTAGILEFLDESRLTPDNLHILVNRYTPKNELRIQDLETIFDRNISFCLNNDYTLCIDAIHKAAPLRTTAPKSRLIRQIRDMASALTGVPVPHKKGIASLFFRGRK